MVPTRAVALGRPRKAPEPALAPLSLTDQVSLFRSQLGNGISAVSQDMIQAYAGVWDSLKTQAAKIQAEIAADEKAGRPPSLSLAGRKARLDALEADIAQQIQQVSDRTRGEIQSSLAGVVAKAQEDAIKLAITSMSPPEGTNIAGLFNRLPARAVESIVGATGAQSPIMKRYAGHGAEVAAQARATLVEGVALGRNPRATASALRKVVGGSLTQHLTLARTETMRAYREGTQETYKNNGNLVRGYVWLCAKQDRTCAMCWALNGRQFGLYEKFATHPNCRCTMLPQTPSYNDIADRYGLGPMRGLQPGPNAMKLAGDGPSLFAKLAPEVQLKILGPSKYAHYKSGTLKLASLIGIRNDPVWGMVRYEKGLDALGLSRITTHRAEKTYAPGQHPAELARAALTAFETANTEALAAIRAQERELMGQRYSLVVKAAELLGKDEDYARVWIMMNEPKNEEERALLALVDDLDRKRSQIRAQKYELEGGLAARARALLTVPDPAKANVEGTPYVLKKFKQGYEGFANLVSNSVMPAENRLRSIAGGKLNRSYYDGLGAIHMGGAAQDRVTVHEMGHWLEDINPEIHQRVVAFLRARTTNAQGVLDEPTHLGRGYDRLEYTRADAFIDPYIGKVYVAGWKPGDPDPDDKLHGTEVLSMGLEYMWADPIGFAKKDPDHFDFTYSVTRGLPYRSKGNRGL